MPRQNRNRDRWRIAGIRLRVHGSWLVLAGAVAMLVGFGPIASVLPGHNPLVYLGGGLVTAALFGMGLLAHELGHSLTAIRAGVNVPEISLFLLGGVSKIAHEAASARDDFRIAVAGPAVNLGLAALFWLLRELLGTAPPTLGALLAHYGVWTNLILGGFNLLPGWPLDGGRVLRALLWMRTGDLVRSTRVATSIGKGLSYALMAFGAYQVVRGELLNAMWTIVLALFLKQAGETACKQTCTENALRTARVREIMLREVVTIPVGTSVAAAIDDYFLHYPHSGFPVTRNGSIEGMLTLEAIKGVPRARRETLRVEDVMGGALPEMFVGEHTPMHEALLLMQELELGRLLIGTPGDARGIVTKTGLERFAEIKGLVLQNDATPNEPFKPGGQGYRRDSTERPAGSAMAARRQS